MERGVVLEMVRKIGGRLKPFGMHPQRSAASENEIPSLKGGAQDESRLPYS